MVPVIHLMGLVPCLLWKNWTSSLTLRGCTDLWLYGLCWTVLFVFLGAQLVSVRSDVYWLSWMVLKGLCLVLDDHVRSLLGMGGLPWWVCRIAGAMLWPEHWGIHPSSCRHFWPFFTIASMNLFDWWKWGDDVVWMKSKSWENCLNSSPLKEGPLSDMTMVGMPSAAKSSLRWADGLEMMCRCHWKHVWELAQSNLPLLGAFSPNGLERSQHLFLPKVWEGPHVGLQHLHW